MTSSCERILIIKLGALGDIILSLEAFHAIRVKHPNAHISILTRPQFDSFVAKMPWFDEILRDPKPRFFQLRKWFDFRNSLRSKKFDRVYDLQCNDRTSLYFKIIGSPRPEWCGTAKGCSHQRHDHRHDPYPATERLLRFLESVDVPRAGEPDLSWFSGDLGNFMLPDKFVLLIPGCAPQHPHKRWPSSSFANLGKLLLEKDISAVAVGTKVDETAINEICEITPSVINLAGKTDLGQLAEVARRSMGVVGNDTGPIHIAAMVEAPTLVLMSEKSDPVRMIPRGPNVGFLRKQDLADLTAEEVMASIRQRK